MMRLFLKSLQKIFSLKGAIGLLMAFLLIGCSDSDNSTPPPPPPPPAVTYTFQLEITNLTNAQPLSPVAFVMHSEELLWEIGQTASTSLEDLAESGANQAVRDLSFVMAEVTGDSPIGPGTTATVSLTFEQNPEDKMISVATMLVNTNDAFTGITGANIGGMAAGDSQTFIVGAYDAGTEANSEMAGTIPGPADMGEGTNVARDDVDIVTRHSGVVSVDDGLTTSVLTEAHRFDNPVARITLTRMQ